MGDKELFADLPEQRGPAPLWRAPRLVTAERGAAGQACYRLRSLPERINADLRRRGLRRLSVRGKAKAPNVLLWHALAHNLRRRLSRRRATLAA